MIYKILDVKTIKIDPRKKGFKSVLMLVEDENEQQLEMEAIFTMKEWDNVRNNGQFIAD